MQSRNMSWQTDIARRVFPHDQTFMAKRKLRIAISSLAVGIAASALFVGLAWLVQHNK